MKPLFTGEIEPSGQFAWLGEQLVAFNSHVARMAKPNQTVLVGITVEAIHNKRTKKQKGFYWLRNQVLATVLFLRPTELHEHNMQALGLGDEVQILDKMVFVRYSSEEIPLTDYAKLIDYQNTVADWWNEDKEQNEHILLPEGVQK